LLNAARMCREGLLMAAPTSGVGAGVTKTMTDRERIRPSGARRARTQTKNKKPLAVTGRVHARAAHHRHVHRRNLLAGPGIGHLLPFV